MKESMKKRKDYNMDLREWIDLENHLPKFMRDFHDQKDLFKCLRRRWGNKNIENVTWVDSHIFTIDFFLRFMAIHGYTLQKNRSNIEFDDIETEIEADRKSQTEKFSKALKDRFDSQKKGDN